MMTMTVADAVLLGEAADMRQGEWDKLNGNQLDVLAARLNEIAKFAADTARRAELELARRTPLLVRSSDLKTNYRVILTPVEHCNCVGFQNRATCRHITLAREGLVERDTPK